MGIEWIQRLSGGKWTDYNYRDQDPHCSNFAMRLQILNITHIQDLLLYNSDDFDLEKNNLFIPAQSISLCSLKC